MTELPGKQVTEHAAIEPVVCRAAGDPQRHGRHRRAYLVVEQRDDRVEIGFLERAYVLREKRLVYLGVPRNGVRVAPAELLLDCRSCSEERAVRRANADAERL